MFELNTNLLSLYKQPSLKKRTYFLLRYLPFIIMSWVWVDDKREKQAMAFIASLQVPICSELSCTLLCLNWQLWTKYLEYSKLYALLYAGFFTTTNSTENPKYFSRLFFLFKLDFMVQFIYLLFFFHTLYLKLFVPLH